MGSLGFRQLQSSETLRQPPQNLLSCYTTSCSTSCSTSCYYCCCLVQLQQVPQVQQVRQLLLLLQPQQVQQAQAQAAQAQAAQAQVPLLLLLLQLQHPQQQRPNPWEHARRDTPYQATHPRAPLQQYMAKHLYVRPWSHLWRALVACGCQFN